MDVDFDLNVESIAAGLFRCVHQKPWRFADAQQRQNYMVIARRTVADTRDEQARQEPEGQKAGAA